MLWPDKAQHTCMYIISEIILLLAAELNCLISDGYLRVFTFTRS